MKTKFFLYHKYLAWLSYIRCLLTLNEYIEVVQLCDEAIEICKNITKSFEYDIKQDNFYYLIQFYHKKAIAFYYEHKYKESLKNCEDTLKINPNFYYAKILKALILIELYQDKDVIEYCNRLINTSPDNFKIIYENFKLFIQQKLKR